MLFARIEDEDKLLKELFIKHNPTEEKPKEEAPAVKEAKKESAPADKEAIEENAGLITFDQFMEVKLKVAEVISCEPVKKSDKLLVFKLDVGGEERQVVSGIAKYYKPEELIGKKVALVYNLAPAKLRGVESQGMLLASSYEDGEGNEKVDLIFIDPSVKSGSVIR